MVVVGGSAGARRPGGGIFSSARLAALEVERRHDLDVAPGRRELRAADDSGDACGDVAQAGRGRLDSDLIDLAVAADGERDLHAARGRGVKGLVVALADCE